MMKTPFRAGSFLCAAVLLVFNPLLAAEEAVPSNASPCSGEFVSVPSRPTVSNGTDTTQCGVLELEYGVERQWLGGGERHDDLSGGLRLGLTPKLDFHWASGDLLNNVVAAGSQLGFGDTWLGLKYRFAEQTKLRPSLGVFYQAKIPSASHGMGSGEVDHSPSLLISKDIHPLHFDFNVIPLLAGRPGRGWDRNMGFALSASVPLTRRLGFVGEGYGYTRLNRANPAFASTMVGVTYQANPRLVLDGGVDMGVTSGAPQGRIFLGITYAVSNLYSMIRPSR